jgi:hypothetical protein
MTHEVYRGELADIAKIYTIGEYKKVIQAKKHESLKCLYVNKKVIRDGIQARVRTEQADYSYVVVTKDGRLIMDYLAFLINSMPLRVMLGDGNKFMEGQNISTTLAALKKLPAIILSFEEQSACAFLNTLITTTCDEGEKNEPEADNMKKAYRYLLGIRDYITLEILLDGVLSNPDISVLTAWMEKKSIFDNTQDKKEAVLTLFKSIFSSNNDLRNRMNNMRLYIEENSEAVFNMFPK